MQSFLEKTVNYLYEKYGDELSELCIVLPNRRAGLFMKTHMAKSFQRTFWAPEIYATEDFVALLSGLQPADPTTLLFELYETVKAVKKTEIESFDEFSKWGQILLSDFNELDRYLTDVSQLFGNLKDIKELEAWSLNKEETLTDFQKQYLEFWKLLGEYYHHFSSSLLEKHMAYQGLAYRIVAEDAEERVSRHPWKKIIFAGFNALNKAEEKIISQLVESDKAEIIWDADAYYLNNTAQEAGRFIRRYNASGIFRKRPENNILFEEKLLSSEPKTITVIGVAKNVAQAKVAGELVSDLEKETKSLQTTALVLADENLLFPVLHSLPSGLKDINVTMGYPLKNTPVSGYFDLLFNLHENGLKLSGGKEKYSFYHSDLIKLLSHPYTAIALSASGNEYAVKKAVQAIQERNIVFASLKMLRSIFEEKGCAKEFELLEPVFRYWQSPEDSLVCITELIGILKDGIISQQDVRSEDKTSLELEYLFAFTKIIKRIRVLMESYPESMNDIKALHGVISQIVRASTLPFYGEPLMGLQVMGMLETRTLDFENVILLSCNEDILPSGKAVNSFIPYELKRYFGLPTYSDKDAIFAYHFYRLLQRASNIYLLYNTESDALGSGEKSRFLTQLIYELPKLNPNVKISEKLVSIPAVGNITDSTISIPKNQAIIDVLAAKAEYGFSPSLLNKYRNCSLEFYFHVIAGLKEADEVEETIGADTLGNAIHEVLEELYKPYIGKSISAADVTAMRPQVETLTRKAFEKDYNNELGAGKNLLIFRVALKFLNNFLDSEIRSMSVAAKEGRPMIIRSLEEVLEATISLKDREVKIKGKADRIDTEGNVVRIIDYKTGMAADKELRLEDWELIRTDSTLSKSFQLLMYALMYHKMTPALQDNFVSGIITFRELSSGLKKVKINGSFLLDAAVMKEFEEQLSLLLEEIFDPETPFSQTRTLENCEYCSFKGICNR